MYKFDLSRQVIGSRLMRVLDRSPPLHQPLLVVLFSSSYTFRYLSFRCVWCPYPNKGFGGGGGGCSLLRTVPLQPLSCYATEYIGTMFQSVGNVHSNIYTASSAWVFPRWGRTYNLLPHRGVVTGSGLLMIRLNY